MNCCALYDTEAAQKGFYPTPPEVADRLLAGIDWYLVRDVLEPSAGTGNLVSAVMRRYDNGQRSHKVNIDCIELDPHLRSVLSYEFCGQKKAELQREYRAIDDITNQWDETTHRGKELTPEQKERRRALRNEIEHLSASNVHIVHDNFLTYNGMKHYQLIVMNPPFADGDAHLLRAIEIQRRGGGQIRCILNAETLKNPYTARRRLLQQQLSELGAEVRFYENAFTSAERRTGVEIAIVSVTIPEEERESEIYERLRRAAQVEEIHEDVTDMTVADFFGQIISMYNVECQAGIALIHEYEAMRPHIMESFEVNTYSHPTITLTVGKDGCNINEYLRLVRLKYWKALFTNKEFVGKLTSNLRKEYLSKVDELADYDFTLFNIQQIAQEMNAQIGSGVEKTIIALFDKLTEAHSWYPECAKNKHYFSGWKTNKVHKINSKVILPIFGVFANDNWNKETFNVREAEHTISDIEKVFEYLDGNMSASVDLHGVLLKACEDGQTKNIHCKFFDVTLYKKGTMHIKFHRQDLVDRFNIYCCGKKHWLPPTYGNVAYDAMSKDEQAVVDGFHGDGAERSGAEAYAEVLRRKSYFLADPVSEMPALMPGT